MCHYFLLQNFHWQVKVLQFYLSALCEWVRSAISNQHADMAIIVAANIFYELKCTVNPKNFTNCILVFPIAILGP